jgi:hypothetical protein
MSVAWSKGVVILNMDFGTCQDEGYTTGSRSLGTGISYPTNGKRVSPSERRRSDVATIPLGKDRERDWFA